MLRGSDVVIGVRELAANLETTSYPGLACIIYGEDVGATRDSVDDAQRNPRPRQSDADTLLRSPRERLDFRFPAVCL